MGVRVDKKSLKHQLELTKNENRLELPFHKKLMNDELPLSIGGGIGQSRMAMLLLKRKHIKEVQAKV
jgi:aspartate--ammonia ligase